MCSHSSPSARPDSSRSASARVALFFDDADWTTFAVAFCGVLA
jgi:hypothetical protein